jgi:cytochrome oxidase assembly protein ShyY1
VTGDWRFARRPFWLFSHLFAASVIASFLGLGLWQLDRLDQRREANAVIEARRDDVLSLDGVPPVTTVDGSDLDYRAVEGVLTIVDPDLVRIGNRSGNGVAGEHVVALAELADGSSLAVNRGFVPLGHTGALDPVPSGPVAVTGWLRATVERGRIGAVDDGTGDLLPRFDTERVGVRADRDLPPVWLQLATIDGEASGPVGLPEALSLPPLGDGPHLGYAVQWFIFATLGATFYGLLLVRRAGGHRTTETVAPIEA